MLKRFFITATLLVGIIAPKAFSVCILPTIFDGILKANVDNEGFVDYDSIRINKGGDLYQFISFVETADLSKCSEAEKTAFWVNAYNAHMIRMVLARSQMKQVSEDFKLFGEKFIEHYAQTREWEWRQHGKAVTDWELRRYFEII